jgi:hypothetical protein
VAGVVHWIHPMTEEDREDLLGIEPEEADVEDAADELMHHALDAGLESEDGKELDPDAQFADEAVKVGREEAEEEEPEGERQSM